MADETEIVNQVLALLGEETVAAIGGADEPSKVRKVRAHLPAARDAVLKRHGWLCALEYVTLSPLAVDGDWRFPVLYQAPEGALRFWTVNRESGWERGIHEEEAGDRLVIRAVEGGALNVSYVKRRRWTAFDPHLVDAIAAECAARACWPVTGSEERAARLRAAAKDALTTAVAADGVDARDAEPPIPDRMAAVRAAAG